MPARRQLRASCRRGVGPRITGSIVANDAVTPARNASVVAIPLAPGVAELTIPFVALQSSGVWVADVCFQDCDDATRSALTAALVYISRGSCVGAVACSPPPAASLSKHCVARGSLVLRLAKQHCFGLNANSEQQSSASSRGCSRLARGETSGPRPLQQSDPPWRRLLLRQAKRAPRSGVLSCWSREAGRSSSGRVCAPSSQEVWDYCRAGLACASQGAGRGARGRRVMDAGARLTRACGWSRDLFSGARYAADQRSKGQRLASPVVCAARNEGARLVGPFVVWA